MAQYALSDLHGRYDLLIMMLKKLNFNEKIDKLFILGDSIDFHVGGLKIYDFCMEHQDCVFHLLGNHEEMLLKIFPLIIENVTNLKGSLETLLQDETFNLFYQKGGDSLIEELQSCTAIKMNEYFRFIKSFPRTLTLYNFLRPVVLSHSSKADDLWFLSYGFKDYVQEGLKNTTLVFGHNAMDNMSRVLDFVDHQSIFSFKDNKDNDYFFIDTGTRSNHLAALNLDSFEETYVYQESLDSNYPNREIQGIKANRISERSALHHPHIDRNNNSFEFINKNYNNGRLISFYYSDKYGTEPSHVYNVQNFTHALKNK